MCYQKAIYKSNVLAIKNLNDHLPQSRKIKILKFVWKCKRSWITKASPNRAILYYSHQSQVTLWSHSTKISMVLTLKADSCTDEIEQRTQKETHTAPVTFIFDKAVKQICWRKDFQNWCWEKQGFCRKKNETKGTNSVQNPAGQRPLCKNRNSEFPRGKVGKTLQVVGTGKGFLRWTLVAQRDLKNGITQH